MATMVMASGQTKESAPPVQSVVPLTQQVSQSQSTLQAFRQEQQALFQERQALMDQGATQEQLAAWRQQNAPQFAAQQQRAQALASASALELRPTNARPTIPANASPALRDFLTTQVALANARAQIHNQLTQGMPATASAGQVSRMEQQERQTFQQQHGGDMQLQVQRAQALALVSAQTPLKLPPATPNIPANASPQMKAFLTARNQLMREQVQMHNQYLTSDPATRQAAMQQWRQQNAGLIQQFQQATQNLAQAKSTTQN
jgi:hypothetical protein